MECRGAVNAPAPVMDERAAYAAAESGMRKRAGRRRAGTARSSGFVFPCPPENDGWQRPSCRYGIVASPSMRNGPNGRINGELRWSSRGPIEIAPFIGRATVSSGRRSNGKRKRGAMSEVRYEDRMRTRPPTGEAVAPTRNVRPEARLIHGRYCTLEPLDVARHAADLYAASHGQPGQERLWDWLPAGPFADFPSFQQWISDCAASTDPLFFAVRDVSIDRATGMASYLNIHPLPATIEIGHVMFGSPLQKTPAATEALYLLMDTP